MTATALEQLLAPPSHNDEPRPKLEGHDDYIFGVLLIAVVVPEEDLVYYQEVDVIMTETSCCSPSARCLAGGRVP